MNEWIMSIVGITALGVLMDILLPEGETNKYIKGIFALFTVFVIIYPLPKIANGDFDYNALFDIFSDFELIIKPIITNKLNIVLI